MVALGGCARKTSPLVGTYHLPGKNAHNLVLAADGTFRWSVEGCSFIGGDNGRWQPVADGVVLWPRGTGWLERDPSPRFLWGRAGFFAHQVDRLLVRAGPDGSVRIEGTVGGEHIDERWSRGRVCVPCKTTPRVAVTCDAPVPTVVRLRMP